MLHLLFAWWALHAVIHREVDAGDASGGAGQALVVEFIAVPSPASNANPTTHSLLQEQSTPQTSEVGAPALPISNDPIQASAPVPSQALGSVPEDVSRQAAQSPMQSASLPSAATDLIARYRASVRASIQQKWSELTDRPFPSGCTLAINQDVGGLVTATSAAGCRLSREDQLQLEAAALMAQPLPYAGFEDVFSALLLLTL